MKRIAIAIVLALSIVTVEFGAHLYLSLTVFGPDVDAELLREFAKITSHLDENGIWRYDDFSGIYYHVDHGLRRTIGQPVIFRHTIWLFGNSAVFDAYVADRDTIAARLQADLPNIRVVNMGINGVTAAQEYLYLRQTPVQPGDIVIFMDGVEELNRPCSSPRLAFIQVLCNTLTNQYPPQNIAKWQKVEDETRRYARLRGAMFIHLIQATYNNVLAAFPGKHLYLPDGGFVDSCCHLNANGDRLVADQIFQVLSEF